MVCKMRLQMKEIAMRASAYVDRAREMARFLERIESAEDDDLEKARTRLQAKYGIAGSLFHALRYRPPKQIAVDVYNDLCSALEDIAAAQIRIFEHEIAKARAARIGPREDVVRKAETVLNEVKALMGDGPASDGN